MRAWAWVQTGRVSLRSFAVRSTRCSNTRERDRERKQTECEANEERDGIRETLERRGESLARERCDRVPGGQDRFELSKIYGRRFDLRARGVTPGSLGQGP